MYHTLVAKASQQQWPKKAKKRDQKAFTDFFHAKAGLETLEYREARCAWFPIHDILNIYLIHPEFRKKEAQ